MKNRKKIIVVALICMCLGGIALTVFWHITRIHKRNAKEEYKIAQDIMWYSNYSGERKSLDLIGKEISNHMFGLDSAISGTNMQEGVQNGKGRYSISRSEPQNGFFRCDIEFSMSMDNVTAQSCCLTSIIFCIDDYDMMVEVLDYLPLHEMSRDGIIWRGTIKCNNGTRKPIVVKLWKDKYYIFVDVTKWFVEYGGDFVEGLLEE